jgi:TnpA family transposase
MRRQQLTEAQIAALFEPPTDRRELVRHCTLSEADSAMIRRCRGDHSRLDYALMLCYLRYPGRPLRINERPPAALISFVAEQIDVRPECIGEAEEVPDHLLVHLSPLGWEHVNLTGDYVWSRADQKVI